MGRVVAASVLLHVGAAVLLGTLPAPGATPTLRRVPLELRVQSADDTTLPVLVPTLPAAALATAAPGRAVAAPMLASPTAEVKPAASSARWLSLRTSPVLPGPEVVAAAAPGLPSASASASSSSSSRGAPSRNAPALDVGGHIDDDGRVTFPAEKPRMKVELPCPSCVGRELVHDLTEWAKDPAAFARTHEGGTGGTLGKPSMAAVLPDPSSGLEPPARTQYMIFVPLLRGHGDLDGAARPNPARKAAFLDATRDERVGVAGRARTRQLAAAAAALPGRLDEIWRDTSVPAAERRRRLFALWDECADDGDGAAARRAIVDFVRARLPRGGEGGYTDAELLELNRGRDGAARFLP